MALRSCEVSWVMPDGRRHTITVEAHSVFHAAILFYGQCMSSPGEKLPRIGPDTVLEVRPVYHVLHKSALAWANREAQKQFKK